VVVLSQAGCRGFGSVLLPRRAHAAWGWDASGKNLAGIAGGMTAVSLTSLFPPVGATFWSHNSATWGSLGENSVFRTSDCGALGVMPSLEVLSLETKLGVWLHRPFVNSSFSWGRYFHPVASWKGVTKPTWRRSLSWWRPGVVA